MSQSANVRSIQAIHDFRIALTNFAEDARNALSSVEMEVRRTRDWLQRDQLAYWQSQVKRCNEQLSMARTELHRRRLSAHNSDAISDTEQKENVRIAQRRLDEAEHKVAHIKRWVPVLEHAISEYHACSQPLGDRLTGSLVNSLALLDRMVATLESYIATAPPPAPSFSTETTNDSAPTRASSDTQSQVATAEPAAKPEVDTSDEVSPTTTPAE